MSAPSIDLVTLLPGQPGAQPRRAWLSLFQKVQITIAVVPTVWAAAWSAGDLVYRSHFETPALWWVLVLIALVEWSAVAIRFGQERLMKQNRALIEYHHDLAERLDAYGDAREIRGQHTATAIRGQGGRPLHVVD